MNRCDEADCHILYDIAKDKLSLYIPEIDARKAVWGGAGSTKAEAEKKYDVDVVKYIPKLKDDVKRWWNKGAGKLFLLHPDQTVAPYSLDSCNLDVGRIDALKLRLFTDLCRVIKDDHEIQLVRRANEVSADAHRAVLENIRSFENESQVAAIFLDTSVSEGAKNQAYNIIAGSGANASVLHYVNNDEPLAGRQVLLIDAGAEWQCYASDVTRTFPISGHWSKEAKEIYDLVNEMQATCIAKMTPGTHFRDLQILAHFIAVTGLLKLGVLHNGTRDEILAAGTSAAFFPHGLGHHVGLEVHDVIDLPFTIQDEHGEHVKTEKLAAILKVSLRFFCSMTVLMRLGYWIRSGKSQFAYPAI
jgi:Xaa-Pro dipeptidase